MDDFNDLLCLGVALLPRSPDLHGNFCADNRRQTDKPIALSLAAHNMFVA